MNGWVTALDLLSPGECAAVHGWVHARRPHWERRDPRVSFFTLGAASHLDAEDGQAKRYLAKAAELNPLLWRGLEWLYQRLVDTLTRELGVRFFYEEALALPGFHIFLDPAFSCTRAGRHFDLEHQLLDWGRHEGVDAAGKLSLTVALCLPASGAGLWLWDINYLELQQLPPETVKRICVQRRAGTLYPYSPGKLALHSGYQLHQMGASSQFQPGEERLTLQAHAQRVRQGYVLYW